MRFLIAYDIAHPKRLKAVADRLERVAERVQKSVFVFEGTKERLNAIRADLQSIIDIHEDRVQAWPLLENTTNRRWDAGTALPDRALCVIVSPHETLILEDKLAGTPAEVAEPPDDAPDAPTAAPRNPR